MQLRFLEYFVALARERHFARAAESCRVSQPTLSAGIATLETQLGRRLIQRDRRYLGLTAEGEAMLPWAQRLLADQAGLFNAVARGPGTLSGELKLGAIPAAQPVVGHIARALQSIHPAIRISIQSLTARQIERGLADFALDAGITYLSNEPLAGVRSVALYEERYIFATRDGDAPNITWRDAAAAPLCLLHGGMQNRRILDTHLATLGLSVQPHVTADSYVCLLALVRAGGLSSILPHSYRNLLPPDPGIHLIDIVDPVVSNSIGLVVHDREPLTEFSEAAIDAARQVQIQAPL